MTYELAKQLKDAGWKDFIGDCEECGHLRPSLSELIEACGEDFDSLIKDSEDKGNWTAHARSFESYDLLETGTGSTPLEAVAKLWLELNKR